VPWFHENALLRVGGLVDDRADDGTRPAGGEQQLRGPVGRDTCVGANAELARAQFVAAASEV
jgi:hypothetical protein